MQENTNTFFINLAHKIFHVRLVLTFEPQPCMLDKDALGLVVHFKKSAVLQIETEGGAHHSLHLLMCHKSFNHQSNLH